MYELSRTYVIDNYTEIIWTIFPIKRLCAAVTFGVKILLREGMCAVPAITQTLAIDNSTIVRFADDGKSPQLLYEKVQVPHIKININRRQRKIHISIIIFQPIDDTYI